jgi:hypothetical protein
MNSLLAFSADAKIRCLVFFFQNMATCVEFDSVDATNTSNHKLSTDSSIFNYGQNEARKRMNRTSSLSCTVLTVSIIFLAVVGCSNQNENDESTPVEITEPVGETVTKYLTRDANVRSRATSSSEKIAKLSRGARLVGFTLPGENPKYQWFKIQEGDYAGNYLSAEDNLSDQERPLIEDKCVGEYQVEDEADFFASPDRLSPKLGQYDANETVRSLGKVANTGDRYYVEISTNGGSIAYMILQGIPGCRHLLEESEAETLPGSAPAENSFVPSTVQSSSPEPNCSDFVGFSFDGPGADNSPQIAMSGPTGTYQTGASGSSIFFASSSSCIGGRYQFTYTNNARWVGGSEPDFRTYSGSVEIPNDAENCSILPEHSTAIC